MKRDKIQKDDEEATATRNSQPRADHGYNAYNSMGLWTERGMPKAKIKKRKMLSKEEMRDVEISELTSKMESKGVIPRCVRIRWIWAQDK